MASESPVDLYHRTDDANIARSLRRLFQGLLFEGGAIATLSKRVREAALGKAALAPSGGDASRCIACLNALVPTSHLE